MSLQGRTTNKNGLRECTNDQDNPRDFSRFAGGVSGVFAYEQKRVPGIQTKGEFKCLFLVPRE